MPSTVGHVTTRDGTDLLVRHWPADEVEVGGAWAGPPWASVLLVHGLGEHSGRYEQVGDQMAGAGLEVTSYDHRGMGGSGGRRGDIARWSRYHEDLGERLADVRAAAGPPTVPGTRSKRSTRLSPTAATSKPPIATGVTRIPTIGSSTPASHGPGIETDAELCPKRATASGLGKTR